MRIELPSLPGDVTWSVRVLDPDGDVLASHEPDVVCETASIGKVFLLIEVASRLAAGTLHAEQPIDIPDEHRVADSGLLYLMRDQRLCVADAALLVGAVSDNLATNALLSMCGVDAVGEVSRSLGYERTALLDYIRGERTPDLPWAPSCGTAADLADLFRRLAAGEVVSAAVSGQVLDWLAVDTDTSMVASALYLDPLAHLEADRGVVLRHKTGTTSVVRADVGHVSGPAAAVAYAVCANWRDAHRDARDEVLAAMAAIGRGIAAHVAPA